MGEGNIDSVGTKQKPSRRDIMFRKKANPSQKIILPIGEIKKITLELADINGANYQSP
jgi:hypothetical protein